MKASHFIYVINNDDLYFVICAYWVSEMGLMLNNINIFDCLVSYNPKTDILFVPRLLV